MLVLFGASEVGNPRFTPSPQSHLRLRSLSPAGDSNSSRAAMGGKIQKRRQDKKKMRDEKKHSKVSEKENKSSNERRLNRRGPRLAPSLQKEIDRMNGTNGFDSYEGGDSDAGETFTGDFYEYEEVIPEEESKKNRRYDAVDNYEYELPDHFKVWVIIFGSPFCSFRFYPIS